MLNNYDKIHWGMGIRGKFQYIKHAAYRLDRLDLDYVSRVLLFACPFQPW